MDSMPFHPDRMKTPWIRDRISALLTATDQNTDDLRSFIVPEDSRHFVLGGDKQGVFWTTSEAFIEAPVAQSFSEIVYHAPSMQTETMVHGGAITAVIDAFAAGCGAIALGYPAAIATAEQTVNFRRPVQLETSYLLHCRFDADATPAASRSYAVVIHGELLDEQGTVAAESRSVIKVPRSARS